MRLAPFLKYQFFDDNGDPLAAGKVYTYAAGTTANQATYTDYGGLSANTNPVILDAAGRANIWLDETLSYKLKVNNSLDVTQYTTDNVTGALAGSVPKWNANTTYAAGDIVADASGEGFLYVSRTSNNLGNALTSVANWRIYEGGFRTLTTNTTLAVTDSLVRSNSTAGALTHTLPPISTTPIGKRITIKDVGTGGFDTTLKGSGSDVIDTVVTYGTTMKQFDSITVFNTGAVWDVI